MIELPDHFAMEIRSRRGQGEGNAAPPASPSVTTGVELCQGVYGVRAVLKAPWSEAAGATIQATGCVELELNHAKGWRGENLSFVASCPWLEAFEIIDFNIRSVAPVHALHELRALKVLTYCATELRFAEFPKLEDCALEWRPKAASLFACSTLRSLYVNRYDGLDLSCFSGLVNLQSLAILNAPAESLDGISALTNLRFLRLANLKKLRSLDGLESLTNLEELEIHTCPNISSIEKLASLRRLRKLHLNNDGKIASLKPINSLPALESVLFYESTNILDGDLTPLTRQKHLVTVSFRNRRHYSHKREDFGTAYSG